MTTHARKGEFEITPEGTFQAVCNGVWDIGRHKSTYKGNVRIIPKIIVRWEITEKMTRGDYAGKRFCITQFYANTSGAGGRLRKEIESWLAKKFKGDDEFIEFDLDQLVGKNCFLTIAHNQSNGQTYANIIGVSGLPKGTGLSELVPENKFELLDWVKKLQEQAVPEEIKEIEPEEGLMPF